MLINFYYSPRKLDSACFSGVTEAQLGGWEGFKPQISQEFPLSLKSQQFQNKFFMLDEK